MIKTLFLLAALALPSHAAAACTRVMPQVVGDTQVYMDDLGNLCMVSVDYRDAYKTMVYRSYGLFSDGLIMVFNSYGHGTDVSRLTSAREFYVFPRNGTMAIHADDAANTLSVTHVNADRLHFDPATGQLSGTDRGTVALAPSVEPGNKGGLEFTSYRGLLLDAGFAMGRSPSGRRDASSTFRDAAGKTCTVQNKEIFQWDAAGEHSLKHDDAQLVGFLRFRCPQLDAGFTPVGMSSPAAPRGSPSKAFAGMAAKRKR